MTKSGKAPLAPCIGWYAPEQYARLREVFTDKDNLHDHWSQWEAKASETLELLRAQGIPARKIAIDLEEMIGWCESEGKPLDGASRAEFISLKCRELGIAEQKQRRS